MKLWIYKRPGLPLQSNICWLLSSALKLSSLASTCTVYDCKCSLYLVNGAFDQTRCAADQFINCAAFDKLCNIWSTALAIGLGLGLGLQLGLGLALKFFFFQSTAQLQYVEDSEPVTRSTWPLVNSAKTELQVQEESDKKRFSTSAPHGRGATHYTETVEYHDMICWEIESLNP